MLQTHTVGGRTAPSECADLAGTRAGSNQGPRALSYNPAESAVLVTSDAEGGTYELYLIPKDAASGREPSPVRPFVCAPSHQALLRKQQSLFQQMLLRRELSKRCPAHGHPVHGQVCTSTHQQTHSGWHTYVCRLRATSKFLITRCACRQHSVSA